MEYTKTNFFNINMNKNLQVHNHLSIFTKSHSGFRPFYSTDTALLKMASDLQISHCSHYLSSYAP